MPTFVPDSNVVEAASSKRYSSKNGWETVRNFSGGESEIETAANQLAGQGYDIEIQYGPKCDLRATIGANVDDGNPNVEIPEYTWELMGNPVEKDLLQADSTSINAIIASDMAFLRAIFDGSVDMREYAEDDVIFTGATAEDLYHMWKAGVKSVQYFAPILKKSITVSRQYQIQSSLSDVQKIWTTAALISAESIPLEISSTLPSSSSITKLDISYHYGWLKSFPQITISSGNKRQLSQEWQWGLWGAVLYDTVGF